MAVRILAAFTFKEALRKRLVLAVACLSVVFLAFFVLVLRATLHPSALGVNPVTAAAARLAGVFLGIYLARSFAGLLAILVAAGAISTEIESGSLQSVLVRPVSRATVVLGKFAGYGLMLFLYNVALQGAVVVIGRIVTGAWLPHALLAVALLGAEPLVLLAATLLGGTFLPTLANGAAMVLLYGLAVVGGAIEQVGLFTGSGAAVDVGVVTSLLLPADTLYRVVVEVSAGGLGSALLSLMGPVGSAVSSPSALMVAYTFCYIAATVGAGAWVLSRRDI